MRRGVWATKGALSKSQLEGPPRLKIWMTLRTVWELQPKLNRSDLIGTLVSIGAGKQYLTTAQGEGIRRAQSCLRTLALGVHQKGRAKIGSLITKEDKLLPIILLGYALALVKHPTPSALQPAVS